MPASTVWEGIRPQGGLGGGKSPPTSKTVHTLVSSSFSAASLDHGSTFSKEICSPIPYPSPWGTALMLQDGSESPISIPRTKTMQPPTQSSLRQGNMHPFTSTLKPLATANGSRGSRTSFRTAFHVIITFPLNISQASSSSQCLNRFLRISGYFHSRPKFPPGFACCWGKFRPRRDRRLVERKASSRMVSMASISQAHRI